MSYSEFSNVTEIDINRIPVYWQDVGKTNTET